MKCSESLFDWNIVLPVKLLSGGVAQTLKQGGF